MTTTEILISLMLAICTFAVVAERLRVSPPVIFLLGGMAFSNTPGLKEFTIEPSQMLTIFLPPLLMEAAYFTSLRDFKRNFRWILQLSVGLVFATAASIAWVFVSIVPGASWASGFVLGAIVSPPDAVAATAVIRNMRVPKRVITILEGESLVNDATGLVLYKFAVAAVLTSQFSLPEALSQLAWMCFAGSVIGIAIGKLYVMLFPRIREISVEILSTFVVPYTAYLMAEGVHGSGVLAVVAAGLYIGWHAPGMFSARFRVPAEAVWKMMTFSLSALVFLLIGIQIPSLLERLSIYNPFTLAYYAVAVCAMAFIVRFAYIYGMGYGLRFLFPSIRKRDPYPAWQNVFLVAFVGMRGVVSLATALALPIFISWGIEFPHRDLIIFLSVSLIVFTLVIQGLALPWVVKKLTLTFDASLLMEDWNARHTAASKALERIAAIESGSMGTENLALARLKSHYHSRIEALGDGPNTPLLPGDNNTIANHPVIQEEHKLWQDLLSIERESVIALRKAFAIGDDTMHDILRELDLLSNRFAH
jgi:CPA1 family monovalent cation:H+ antiporter